VPLFIGVELGKSMKKSDKKPNGLGVFLAISTLEAPISSPGMQGLSALGFDPVEPGALAGSRRTCCRGFAVSSWGSPRWQFSAASPQKMSWEQVRILEDSCKMLQVS